MGTGNTEWHPGTCDDCGGSRNHDFAVDGHGDLCIICLDRLEEAGEQSIRTVADEYGYDILSLHISADHVHLFLSAHPKHAPSEIVRTVKSVTAREMWEQHDVMLERGFWSGGFWERLYYVGTTGEMSSRTVE